MMCLSQTAGYAIHALSVLANCGGRLCLVRDIARRSGVPKPYLAKIVSQLSRQGLVAAKRGLRGGIYLTREPAQICLLDVVQAIEGKDFIARCMLSLDDCSAPCICPTHDVWERLRTEITEALSRTTLAQVLEKIEAQAEKSATDSNSSAIVPERLGRKEQSCGKLSDSVPCCLAKKEKGQTAEPT